MDIEFLNPASAVNMNENDLFKTIKGQKKAKAMREEANYQEALKKELEAFRSSWSKRNKEELLEALLKIKKCELEMKFGLDTSNSK
tara:strand:+ start:660 stop:917 length:258 start_codon:yes stop_codon:yes gene_type:complete